MTILTPRENQSPHGAMNTTEKDNVADNLTRPGLRLPEAWRAALFLSFSNEQPPKTISSNTDVERCQIQHGGNGMGVVSAFRISISNDNVMSSRRKVFDALLVRRDKIVHKILNSLTGKEGNGRTVPLLSTFSLYYLRAF